MKKILSVFLVIVLAGCAKPAGPKKIDIDIHNLYDKVYDPQNKVAVAYMSSTRSWFMPPKEEKQLLKTAKKSWWRTDGSTTRPTTQPTSRPVHDVVVVLTPNSVNEKTVKPETTGETKILKGLPKYGLDIVTCDGDIKKYGCRPLPVEEYLELKKGFE